MKLFEFRFTVKFPEGQERCADIVALDIHTAIDVFLREYRGCEIQWIILKSSNVLLG